MNKNSLKYNAISALKKLMKIGASQGQVKSHGETMVDPLEINEITDSSLQKMDKMEDSVGRAIDKFTNRLIFWVTVETVALLIIYDYVKNNLC